MGTEEKREWFLNLTLGVLAICALLVTGMAVRREFFTSQHAGVSHPDAISEWRSFADHGHLMGPPEAPVTIVEFSDFECPFCGRLEKNLHQLRAEHPADVAIVYRHFPLSIHPFALAAVRASECAAAQGRFTAFHDALFAEQDSLGTVPWDRFALKAGVPDLTLFRRCDADTGAIPALSRDTLDGKRLGVSATPTLLINGLRIRGAPPLDALEAYVEDALREQREHS